MVSSNMSETEEQLGALYEQLRALQAKKDT